MANRNVLIYCDADTERGMGHLMRSLCLAEEAGRRGWSVSIAGRFGGRAVEHAAVLAPDQQLIRLEGEAFLEQLQHLLATRSADLLHLDSYDTALDSFDAGEVPVSNMQDGEFGRRAAELHIDANLDADLRYRPVSAQDTAILGTAGMQLRRAVRAEHHRVRADLGAPFRMLVMLGGSDPFDLTPRVVHELLEHPEVHLTVICRPEMQPKLNATLEGREHRVDLLSFTGALPALANSMDAVVTAAGTSVWDFAAMGLPMGIIAVTENQLPGYRACEARGLGIPLGEPPHLDLSARVAALIAALRDRERMRELSSRGTAVVDGLGSWRVVSAWEQLVTDEGSSPAITGRGLSARLADESDAQRLFDWRNDASTRAASRSSEPVAWEDHLAWLHRVLADADRRLLVVEETGEAVATVRWDRHAEHSWEASITLAPEHRGRGLGSRVLSAGEGVFSEPVPVRLLAGIHVSNAASRRLFARAGYLPHLPADDAGFEMRAKWLMPQGQA